MSILQGVSPCMFNGHALFVRTVGYGANRNGWGKVVKGDSCWGSQDVAAYTLWSQVLLKEKGGFWCLEVGGMNSWRSVALLGRRDFFVGMWCEWGSE